MFRTIKTKIRKHKSKFLTLGMLTLVFTFLIFPETALAVSGNDILNTTFAKITSVFKVVLDVLSLLLWPVILMIGGLIQNDIIFGGGMEDKLRDIWVEVRNIVNIFFVLGLLGIAFYNVLGVGEDKIKQFLPKLIIGIIAVNFTFLASKVVLDAANVLTVSLFSIPQSIDPEMAKIMPDKDGLRTQFENGICKSLYDPVSGASQSYITDIVNEKARKDALATKKTGDALTKEQTRLQKEYTTASTTSKKSVYDQVKDSLICKDLTLDFSKITLTKAANNKTLTDDQKAQINRDYFFKLFDKFDANNAALAMALNLQKIYKIRNVQIAGKFDKLALNIIFSVVLYIIYASAYVALFAVLVVRVLVLWICIIFSPAAIFSSKLGGPSIPGISDNADKLVDNFIKHVQAPIIIAATMTIGYIMLRAFQGGGGTSLFDIPTGNVGLPTSGLDTFKELLIAIATCAIVWMGVFAAAEETIAKGFTDGLRNLVGGLGKFVLKSPQYLPLIPIKRIGEKGKSEPVPLASVLRGFQSLPTELENRAKVYERSQDFVRGLLGDTGPKKVGQGGTLQEERKLLARYKQGVPAGKIDYTLWSKNKNIQSMLTNAKLSKAQRTAIDKAIREGKEISSKTGGPAWAAWQQFVKNNQLDLETPAPGGTGTTPAGAGQANAKEAGDNFKRTLGALGGDKSPAYLRARNALSSKEQTALDALSKARNNATEYAKAVTAAGGADAVQKLQKKISYIRDTGASGYTSQLSDASKREQALKSMAGILEGAGVGKDQIRTTLSSDLTKAGVSADDAKRLLDTVLNKTT